MSFRVLITDDEDHFRQSLVHLLEAEGFRVDGAPSGKASLSLLNEKSYDVVLLDLGLPDIPGIDIAEFIIDRYPYCGIVILTGQASIDSAIKAIRYGCYDYLTKPCHPKQVIRSVRRAAEHFDLKRQLAASHAKLKVLAEASSEGIAILEGEVVADTNGRFLELFKLDGAAVLAVNISDLLPTIDLSPCENRLGLQEPVCHETEGVRTDGSIFPVELRIRNIDTQPSRCTVLTVRDLTHALSEQRAKQTLEKKLAHALRMESIGLMAGSVAHDLNNILSGLVTFPELLLLDMPGNARYRQDIEKMQKAGKKAAEVVADLLTIARGSTCKKDIRNINEIITEYFNSLAQLEQQTGNPQIRFTADLQPDLPNVEISNLHLTKTLLNLVKNGVEAIDGKPGKIAIRTSLQELSLPLSGFELIPAGKWVVMEIADSGPGIPQEHLQHIFEPFYSRKRMGRSGSGLGLTIVMHTMKDHDGYIDIHSSHRGTVFSLYFPVCEQGDSQQRQAEFLTLRLEDFQGNGETVLVVDDEESERQLAASVLKRLGYTPFTAGSGGEALRILNRQPMDLLLLDMVLTPEMTGYETCLKAREINEHQKMIITSGDHNHPDRQRLQELGIQCCLNKPIRLSHLALAIHRELLPAKATRG